MENCHLWQKRLKILSLYFGDVHPRPIRTLFRIVLIPPLFLPITLWPTDWNFSLFYQLINLLIVISYRDFQWPLTPVLVTKLAIPAASVTSSRSWHLVWVHPCSLSSSLVSQYGKIFIPVNYQPISKRGARCGGQKRWTDRLSSHQVGILLTQNNMMCFSGKYSLFRLHNTVFKGNTKVTGAFAKAILIRFGYFFDKKLLSICQRPTRQCKVYGKYENALICRDTIVYAASCHVDGTEEVLGVIADAALRPNITENEVCIFLGFGTTACDWAISTSA